MLNSRKIKSFNRHYNLFRPVLLIYVVLLAMVVVFFWNRYIFQQSNIYFLFSIILFYTLALTRLRIPKNLFFSGVTFFMLFFVLYMIVRLNDNSVPQQLLINDEKNGDGLAEISYQMINFGLFILSAILWFNKGRFSFTLWLIVLCYIFALIIRCSLDSGFGAHIRYSNNPGFILFPFITFLFLIDFRKNIIFRYIPHIVLYFCCYWLILLGSRGAYGSILAFYLCMVIWPIIAKNRFVFLTSFWVVLSVILISMWALTNIGSTDWEKPLTEASLKIGRYKLWQELLTPISERPFLGFGTGFSSASILAPEGFPLNRDNVPSTSTYVEILLRLGIFGLIIYILFFFKIWEVFWIGKEQMVVRVAGSFLIAIFFYIVTREFMIFNTPLQSGFACIILGSGLGESLRCKKNKREQEFKGIKK